MRLVALLVVLALPLPALAGNCPGCLPPDNLCVKHEEAEAEALKDWRKAVRDKDPMKKVAALEKLGKLNDEHTGTATKDMADAIAPMLEDTDSGIRQKALEFMQRNQHKDTAIQALGKVLKKIVPKIDKPKPSGKAAMKGQDQEWQNAYDFAKQIVTALQGLGGDDIVEFLIVGIQSKNLEFAVHSITASTTVRSKKFIQAYLDRCGDLDPSKDEGQSYTFNALAGAFNGMAGYTEQCQKGAEKKWLPGAAKFWRENEDAWK